MKKIIVMILLLFSLILIGCTQQVINYVCPDGSTVSDVSLCPEKKVYCDDGTIVDDRSKCCEIDFIKSDFAQVAILKYCKDVTGSYTEKRYCDGDYHVREEYRCQSNRCILSTDMDKCVDGATCEPYGNGVNCVPK